MSRHRKNRDTSRRPRREPAAGIDLRTALGDGDLPKIKALIEAGSDLHYKRDGGYDALLDAVHGRDICRDPRLLELLAFLVSHGVDLCGVSTHGESGLRVLSRIGRFDAVRLLLDAGADRSQLAWTPLMEAVALGSLADVRAALEQGAALEERDSWSRTPFLIALLAGDIAKAKLLRDSGADPAARGHCRHPPLYYAIQGHHAEVLRWLLRAGTDVHETDEFGTTALMEAAENGDLECVKALLEAGADVDADANGTALRQARSRDIIMCLLDAGADPADANQRIILGFREDAEDALDGVLLADFQRAFTRVFGRRNPQRMVMPFWEAMIRSGVNAYGARRRFQCHSLREPVWCAQRFGQSLTLLHDGRAVQIGGEHEDYYDPDFCIYNDVFVHERDGSVAIYGYPESVFPPTDFHTATLVGDFIYVIGSLGYWSTRRGGETPLYRLNIHTLRMERLDARGESPGRVYKHRATVSPQGIRVWGGMVLAGSGREESHEPNSACFLLDLDRLAWRRESTRGGLEGGPREL